MPIVHDEFGPEYVVEVYDPQVSMRGFLVIDNTALGPGKGGIRMTSTVTVEEVFRLARTMTWKTALADIPFGGAKAGIVWEGGDEQQKMAVIQSFARAISPFTPKLYIAAPDVNSGELEMQWFVEATGKHRSATGKPANLCETVFGWPTGQCGLPHEYGSTGFGVAHAGKMAAGLIGLELTGATVAIEGFGNVGSFVFKHLAEMGAKIVAVADSKGGVYQPTGLDYELMTKIKKEKGSVIHYPDARPLKNGEIFTLPVDILIPAALPDVITTENVDQVKAKIIVEGANIPIQPEVEEQLFQRGALVVPDFVANAGGVISSYAEYRGYNPRRMFQMVERKIKQAVELVLSESLRQKRSPRVVGLALAGAMVRTAQIKHRHA